MRLASFFLISVTLHALALVYPVSFADPKQAELIRVMILPVEHETSGANGQDGGSGSRASRAGAKAPGHAARALQSLVQSNQTGSPEPRPQFGEAPIDLNENNSAALVFVPSKSGEADGAAKIPLAGDDGNWLRQGCDRKRREWIRIIWQRCGTRQRSRFIGEWRRFDSGAL